MANEEFKFPDEVEKETPNKAAAEDNFSFEIEDDTPLEDRNRKPLATPPEDPSDDELSSYDEKVQARIKKFTRGYHDERRAKEEALREREAAEGYARQVIEENKRLQQQLAQGSQIIIDQSKVSAEAQLDSAKKKYKAAYEAGDTDNLVDAQAEISAAMLRLDKAHNLRPLQVRENEVQTQQRVSAPQTQMTDRDAEWQSDNKWFGSDEEMTSAALGLHQKLLKQHGEKFIGSRDYYKAVDATMRKRFPENFGSDEDFDDTSKTSEPAYEYESPRRATKPANVVAPATRSTPPNRIRLKASEAAIARRLGVPLELYAKQVAQLRNGE